MRCLVTGAAGHLGSYLTRLLLDRGHSVTILVRPSSDLWRLDGVVDKLHVIRNPIEVGASYPDVTFHLAWSDVTGTNRNAPDALINNITDSLELFRILKACRCWIGIGSQAEYGPSTSYGVAKRCTGQLLEALCAQTGARFVWLRLFATYGPQDDSRRFIPCVIESLLAGRVPSLTSGNQPYDYLYVQDAAEAIYRAAITPSVSGMYDLCSGSSETIRNIAETIRDMIDPNMAIAFGEADGTALQSDDIRIHKETGWSPQIDLKTGLLRTVEWHKIKGCIS